MPDFKNKEEYQKWKAERLKSSVEKMQAEKEAEKQALEKVREDERLSKLWICPECLNSNDSLQLECQCGYTLDEKYSEYFKGNLKSTRLYKIIKDMYDFNNDDKEVFLSFYLLKRFPETYEANKIKGRMDDYSKKVVCGKCGSQNIYNPKYYQKDKCEKCGNFLYQYIKEDSNQISINKKETSGFTNFYRSPRNLLIILASMAVIIALLSSSFVSNPSPDDAKKAIESELAPNIRMVSVKKINSISSNANGVKHYTMVLNVKTDWSFPHGDYFGAYLPSETVWQVKFMKTESGWIAQDASRID